jgi:tetratricopeptide (TPR) repeat protein
LRESSSDHKPMPTPANNTVAGIVVGPSVQAGTIAGGVHVHLGNVAAREIPHQLIGASPHFVGRDRERSSLDRLVATPARGVAVLSGPGGVGKTGLARRWAQDNKDLFPDGQLYIDLEGFGGDPPVDPREALSVFLRALGVPSAELPSGLAELAALYRTRTADRTLLVVLDNAYSAAQVRVLLPTSSASLALVTSRNRLAGLVPDGAVLIEVPPLPVEESLTLLARIVGAERVDAERAAAERLAAICGGLPIALCLVGARLAARPRLTLARVSQDLSDEPDRLGALDRSYEPSIQAAFDWSYRSLDPAPAALYRRLALHPGLEFGLGPIFALTPAIVGERTAADGIRLAEALLEANLLQEVAEDRFRAHDLLRRHARQRTEAEDAADIRTQALLTVLEWYLAAAAVADQIATPYRRRLPYVYRTAPPELPVFAGRDDAVAWLDGERLNLIAAASAALDEGWAELSWQLADAIWALLLYRKHYRDRMIIDVLGVRAARLWNNPWAEGRMLKRLGRTCTVAGDYAAAEEHLRTAMLRSREAGDAHGAEEAHEMLASLYRDAGRLTLARETFDRVLVAKRDLGEPRNVGLTLINIGMLLTRMGRTDEAIAALHEADAIIMQLVDADPYNAFRAKTGLAGAYLRRRDLDRAHDAAAEAAAGMRTVGSAFEEAEALDLLARVAEERGDVGEALDHLRRALGIFEDLGSARASVLRERIALHQA